MQTFSHDSSSVFALAGVNLDDNRREKREGVNLDDNGREKREGVNLDDDNGREKREGVNLDDGNGTEKREGINLDDDGREKREGTWIDASAHLITAVIGSGLLSFTWCIAQLGWVAGPAIVLTTSFLTYYTSTLLVEAYRTPHRKTGKRNSTYVDSVREHLGARMATICGVLQYLSHVGIAIKCTTTASISMTVVGQRSSKSSSNNCIIIFSAIQVFLSQIRNIHNRRWLNIITVVMSFIYAFIGMGLSIEKIIGEGNARTSLTGIEVGIDVSGQEKVWRGFQAIAHITFAYSYFTIFIEVEDTLGSHPSEYKAMKKASSVGVLTTTIFYMLSGCLGYAAFGNDAPLNFFTGFRFYGPFWLVIIANVCIAIHLIGVYQVFCQDLFNFIEIKCRNRWPSSNFITTEHHLYGEYYINMFRVVSRTTYVILIALLVILFPFFKSFAHLIEATSFYPMTVYFPIEMYIVQRKIQRSSFRWVFLKILCVACLGISLVVMIGAAQELQTDVRKYRLFQT